MIVALSRRVPHTVLGEVPDVVTSEAYRRRAIGTRKGKDVQ
jgi:hypothetical protein